MNYELWKIFLDAVELGSLSKVAMLHNTNQPQISRQMNELEAQCGGRLFNRTGRGVELTDLGQHLLPKIRSWLNVTDQLNNEFCTRPIHRLVRFVLPVCRLLHIRCYRLSIKSFNKNIP